ncbi:MAG: metallophosphatase [Bacteroidaceae bacterium]|nr:metallophosphatase [Bacteroidaceae bacterium]
MKRILQSIIAAAIILCHGCSAGGDTITILHTNDTHSHIEPEKNGGGGLENRAALIASEREKAAPESTLLLDCGDFSQGSLYYNVFKGMFEIQAMNLLGYDASAIGNHEFDFGLDNLALLAEKAEFPLLCANLDFSDTPCKGLIEPYTIIERSGVKIGLFGLSPKLDGLVLRENYEGVRYLPPLSAAQECADELRRKGCDIIICLSHLGWDIPGTYSDTQLAAETSGIDIILGGHSHDLFDTPRRLTNKTGEEVVVQQAGKYGRNIGKIVISLDK